jgi:AraC-like DNA-binding protein
MLAGSVKGLQTYLKASPQAWRQVLTSAGLEPKEVEDGDARVPLEQGFKAFAAAAEWAGDPALGIHYAESIAVGATGPVGFALVNAHTLRDAMTTMSRFISIFTSLQIGRYEEDRNDGSIVWRYPGVPSPYRLHFMTWGAAALMDRLRPALPAGWKPQSLEFDIAPPADTTALGAHFGPGLRFGCPISRFAVAAGHLDRPMPSANPRIFQLMTRLAEFEQERRGLHASVFETEVREAIAAGLSDGRTTLAEIARSLGMTPLRLRRELKQRDLEFRPLLDDVRRNKARDYLAGSNLSITQIAFQLGYSDSSVFTRACRDWFGQTPREFRSRNRPLQTGTRDSE